jgi:hypothetical protein
MYEVRRQKASVVVAAGFVVEENAASWRNYSVHLV